MAIDRTEYKIKISTEADLAQMQAYRAQLDGQRQAYVIMGKDVTELDAKISKLTDDMIHAQVNEITGDSAAEGVKKTGEAAEKGGEQFKIFGRGAHEAHAAIDALGQAIPGVGELIRFLSNPITATIGLAVLAFSKFKEAVAATMDTLNQLADSPGARGEWVDKETDAVEKSTVAFALWEDQIRRLTIAQETLKQKTDELVQQQNTAFQTQNEIAQAEKALEEAKVDLAEKLGQISHGMAINIKLQIDEKAFKQQAEIKIKEMEAELNTRTRALAQDNNEEPAKRSAVEQAQAAADAADKAKTRNEEKLAQDQKNLEDSKTRQAAAEKIAQDLKDKEPFYGYDKSDPQYYAMKAAQDTVESEQNQQGGLRRAIAQEKGRQPALEIGAGTAAKDLEDAKKAYEDAAQMANDQIAQMKKLKADLEVEKAKAAALETIHNQTAQTTAAASLVTPPTPQETANSQKQNAAAHEQGPQAAIDARHTSDNAKILLSQLHSTLDVRAHLAEINESFAMITGFAQNVSQELNSQREEMRQLRKELNQAIQRANNGRTYSN